ncbi:MAG: SusC/RagA family TonB-linked outer membrane protein [Bacteroidia bacterium]|nr:SusC/RagA family TonB-linked outer membrane protein [Bacteroidia bacterium]
MQAVAVTAQTGSLPVAGRVLDAQTGEPLIGCTVTLQGSTTGALSGDNGQFAITVPSAQSVLVFSYVGYTRQEVAVAGRTTLEVLLAPAELELGQVLLIGYGTATKKDLTGSITSIREADFNKGIINSPEQLLQGKVAGLNVTAASGEPGTSQSITVRGPGGVRTGSTPLFVLDGFALDNSSTGGAVNPLTFLNAQDIESIDVLKDASATAIYGARGANGVILITTKRGQTGQARVSYNGSFALSSLANALDVFTADQYRQEVVKLGGTLDDRGNNTDWQREITRQAYTHNHNVSMGGGAGKLSYYASFGVQNQQGIIKGSQLNTLSGRINATQKLWNDRISVDVNLNATNTVNERPPYEYLIGTAISANPTYPAYDADGNAFVDQGFTSPLKALDLEKNITTTNRVLASITPSVTIFKGLVYKLNYGLDNSSSTQDLQSLASELPKQDGRLEARYINNRNELIENYLTYTYKGAQHSLTALAGQSYQKIFVQGRSFSINKFPVTDIEPIYNPGLGQDLTLANNKPTGFAVINELQSFFARANYQYAGKYLATATVRADGSSKFGANNKYGVFPSFSLGWRISDEAFMEGSPFSELKLRAGWGTTGNQEIPSKITQSLFTSQVSGTSSYPLTPSGPFPAGTSYVRLANPDIQWEVSTQTDLGIDFGLFEGALTGTIDYFSKVSNNILLEVIPADPVQPASSFWTNVEDMTITNQGLEFALNYRYLSEGGFNLEVGGNLTLIKNVVEGSPYSVIPSGSASGSGLTSATINGYVNGQPIGTFFLKEFTGFDENGLSTYADTDGNGIETDADRIAAGTALPNRIFGINAEAGYKGFALRANLNGVSGNKIYDNTANASFYKLRLSKGINTTAEAIAFEEESINNAAPVSTRYLKDAAFLRLNNVALDYTLDPSLLGLTGRVQTIRLSVTGQNLWVLTQYDGYDPEVNTDRTINGVSSYGIDYLSYPRAKTLLFGLNLIF